MKSYLGPRASVAFGFDANQSGSVNMGDVTCIDNIIYNYSNTYNQIGNITRMSNNSYTYGSTPRPHAVTQVGSTSYAYDGNGNMLSGAGRSLGYDTENRLVWVDVSPTVTPCRERVNGQALDRQL